MCPVVSASLTFILSVNKWQFFCIFVDLHTHTHSHTLHWSTNMHRRVSQGKDCSSSRRGS